MYSCVEFDSVGKRFSGRGVFTHVSFGLAAGSCLSLVGDNGSGKSTILRIACGLVRPDAGRFQVFDGDPARDGRVRARIASLFEGGRALYGRLTPEENVRYLSSLKGRDTVAAMRRFTVLCERFGILGHARTAAQLLSRGTQQKMSAICALCGDEELWLLDEPTLGLDPDSCAILAALVREHRERGGAVLAATHDLEFAVAIGSVKRMAEFTAGESAPGKARLAASAS